MSVAKRRAIDYFRRAQTAETKYSLLGHEMQAGESEETVFAALDEDYIADDLLRLMFVACHPVLSVEARVALTLRLLGGLSTTEIARAFLSSEPTIAQRIVRAKRSLAEARVPFEFPDAAQRMQRLTSVLEVIYLIFNEGYSASSGDDILRPALSQEALRLGRVLSRTSAPGGRGAWARRFDGASIIASASARRGLRRARTSSRTGSGTLGPDADPARACCARACGTFAPTARPLYSASGNRGLPCTSAYGAGNRLGAHRRTLRCARRVASHCSSQAEPCRCRRHGLRTREWARASRCATRRALAQLLSSLAKRSRRPSRKA